MGLERGEGKHALLPAPPNRIPAMFADEPGAISNQVLPEAHQGWDLVYSGGSAVKKPYDF